MTTSESITELAAALAKAQGQMHGAKKDSENPFFKSAYADLASVWDACRQPLSAHGLGVLQFPTTAHPDNQTCVVAVTTRLLHSSGQWVEDTVSAVLAKSDLQAVGSAITYLRRYSLQAVCGIAPEDDDGERAMPSRSTGSHAPPKPLPPAARDWHERDAPIPPAATDAIRVTRVTPRPTKKPGVTRFEIELSDGLKAATINEKLAKQAMDARDSGAGVSVMTKKTDYGTDLVALHITVSSPEIDDEAIPF